MPDKPQVFLLHFAGGNVYSFQFLKKYFDPDFEFIPLELPGRGKRLSEPLLTEREDAVHDYLVQIQKRRNGRLFIVYGHSMGASLALEVVALLGKAGDNPAALVVSGKAWPVTGVNHQRHLMPASEFKEGLRELGGIPEKVLENEKLFNFFTAALRSDLEIIEKKEIAGLESINIGSPIIALMGDEEEGVIQIGEWQRLSAKTGITQIFPGNHFFIHNHAREISEIMRTAFSAEQH